MMMTILVNMPLILLTIFGIFAAMVINYHDSLPDKKPHSRKKKQKHAH